jgi:Fe-S-cluster containining protein
VFKCDCCGECCRNLDKSDLYKELNRGDGVCKFLMENLCSIYDNRPLLCRIDDSYDIYFKDRYTKEEYYKLNYEVCKKLQVKGE